MRAIVYRQVGDPSVLTLVERDLPEPGAGEVRVRVAVSGLNPTDWKDRRGLPIAFDEPRTEFPEIVPHQDGAGTVDAVGPGVIELQAGQRAWVWEAAWQRPDGTAQQYVVLPQRQAVPLPAHASFELGASLGIPALTAHRCLTVGQHTPARLFPGALTGSTVLVAGGAGAVGNVAIQLARWAGARVLTTVSSADKADLARAAGAEGVVNYRTEDAVAAVRRLAPSGVDLIAEVAPEANAELDSAVLARDGTVALYARGSDETLTLPLHALMPNNARYQFVLVYTMTAEAKQHAVDDVSSAVAAGALGVGEAAGLPLQHFPLSRTAEAHETAETGATGKIVIDLDDTASA